MPVENQEKEDAKTQSATEGSSFWKTLPGVLTAVASLLTAIAGLVLAIHQLTKRDAGGDPNKKNETHAVTSATQDNNTPFVSDKSSASATETQSQTKSNVAASDARRDTQSGDTGQPPGFPPKTQPPPVPTTDELASRTSRSLPGDMIRDLTYVGSSGLSVTVAVEYAYSPRHRGPISVRATTKGVSASPIPTVLTSPGPAVVNIPLKLKTLGESTEIVVFLYEPGQPLQPFAERTFPFKRKWTEF